MVRILNESKNNNPKNLWVIGYLKPIDKLINIKVDVVKASSYDDAKLHLDTAKSDYNTIITPVIHGPDEGDSPDVIGYFRTFGVYTEDDSYIAFGDDDSELESYANDVCEERLRWSGDQCYGDDVEVRHILFELHKNNTADEIDYDLIYTAYSDDAAYEHRDDAYWDYVDNEIDDRKCSW